MESVAGGGGARVQPGRGLPLGLSGAAAAAPGRRAERPQPPRQGRWAPAGRLARRSWAASAAASGAGESNTFSLNFPAPVPANTHSRTHTRAQGEPLRGEPTGTGGSLAASFSLPRSYWRGALCGDLCSDEDGITASGFTLSPETTKIFELMVLKTWESGNERH